MKHFFIDATRQIISVEISSLYVFNTVLFATFIDLTLPVPNKPFRWQQKPYSRKHAGISYAIQVFNNEQRTNDHKKIPNLCAEYV